MQAYYNTEKTGTDGLKVSDVRQSVISMPHHQILSLSVNIYVLYMTLGV